jgi:hypothetical protein
MADSKDERERLKSSLQALWMMMVTDFEIYDMVSNSDNRSIRKAYLLVQLSREIKMLVGRLSFK